MKFLFFSLPIHGHVYPTLPVAQELVARGEEVTFFLPEEFESAVRRTGASFQRLEDTFRLKADFSRAQAGPRVSFRALMPHMTRFMARALNEAPQLRERVRAERADCLVYDPMALWGRAVAWLLKLPTATFYTSYAMRQSSPLGQRLNTLQPEAFSLGLVPTLLELMWVDRKLHRRHGLPRLHMPELFTSVEPLNIIPVPRLLQSDASVFDERYLFVGPTGLPREEEVGDFPLEQLAGRPTLLISLGTTPGNLWLDFYRACFEAFGGTRWQVVLATGQWTDRSRLGPAPSNFIVRPQVPQLAVLRHARVFISHGGMNSTLESLWHGVPLLVLPQVAEQALTASLLAELELGLQPASTEARSLREAVERLDTEPGWRERISRVQALLQEGGGARRAADALQQYVRGGPLRADLPGRDATWP